jgi:hypothetical protein
VSTPGGGWLLGYHQEKADPADRDRMFPNRGLMRCIADQVPVGVLRERAPAGHRSRYEVLGLATPVQWSDGYFYFESLDPKAVPTIDPVSDVLEATVRTELGIPEGPNLYRNPCPARRAALAFSYGRVTH